MPVILEPAPEEVYAMAREILEAHHPELKMPDGSFVTLCIFMASNGRGEDGEANDEPPLKLHGYPCAATIKVIPYEQRVDERADAQIKIDERLWKEKLTDAQRRALLDHEITHLEIQVDDVGFVKTDDTGRPKLKLKLHDWQLGGFRSIAQRYGADAMEVMEARQFEKDQGDVALAGQNLFA